MRTGLPLATTDSGLVRTADMYRVPLLEKVFLPSNGA